MSKRRLILAILALGIFAALYAIIRNPTEPSYGGHPLTYWLHQAHSLGPEYQRQEAQDAIRHIGTNALPHLLRSIRYELPAWKARFDRSFDLTFDSGYAFRRWTNAREYRADEAIGGFEALGPAAETAIPELARLMNDPKAPQTAMRAARSLSFLGKRGLPPLLAGLSHQNPTLRGMAAAAMSTLGSNAGPAIPALVQCLKDTNHMIAFTAATTLGYLKLEPSTVVPALAKATTDPRAMVSIWAAYSLEVFGEEARPAVPALRILLTAPDLGVRTTATNALLKIAPELLTNAPPP